MNTTETHTAEDAALDERLNSTTFKQKALLYSLSQGATRAAACRAADVPRRPHGTAHTRSGRICAICATRP